MTNKQPLTSDVMRLVIADELELMALYLRLPMREQNRVHAFIHEARHRQDEPERQKTFDALERFNMWRWDMEHEETPEATCESHDLTAAQYERYRKALCIILAVDEEVTATVSQRYGMGGERTG